jgi:sulfoxide reductase catalytic subunit YedY
MPENVFDQRRRLIKALTLSFLGVGAGAIFGCRPAQDAARIGAQENPPGANLYPVRRNNRFALDRPVTE